MNKNALFPYACPKIFGWKLWLTNFFIRLINRCFSSALNNTFLVRFFNVLFAFFCVHILITISVIIYLNSLSFLNGLFIVLSNILRWMTLLFVLHKNNKSQIKIKSFFMKIGSKHLLTYSITYTRCTFTYNSHKLFHPNFWKEHSQYTFQFSRLFFKKKGFMTFEIAFPKFATFV